MQFLFYFKGFHTSGPDEDVFNFMTSKDPLFGAKVVSPTHNQKFYPSEGSDSAYSPNSLSPLSEISPMPIISPHGQPSPPRTTPPPPSHQIPTRPYESIPPRLHATFPPRAPAHHKHVPITPKSNTILKPSSSIAPWPQWPVKSVFSDFSEAIMKPHIEEIHRFV